MLNQAMKDAGAASVQARPDDLVQIGAHLRRSASVFVREELRQEAIEEIARACGLSTRALAPTTVDIRVESDITRARSEARRMCESLGAAGFALQKVTTIVSELARNIVSYTEG